MTAPLNQEGNVAQSEDFASPSAGPITYTEALMYKSVPQRDTRIDDIPSLEPLELLLLSFSRCNINQSAVARSAYEDTDRNIWPTLAANWSKTGLTNPESPSVSILSGKCFGLLTGPKFLMALKTTPTRSVSSRSRRMGD